MHRQKWSKVNKNWKHIDIILNVLILCNGGLKGDLENAKILIDAYDLPFKYDELAEIYKKIRCGGKDKSRFYECDYLIPQTNLFQITLEKHKNLHIALLTAVKNGYSSNELRWLVKQKNKKLQMNDMYCVLEIYTKLLNYCEFDINALPIKARFKDLLKVKKIGILNPKYSVMLGHDDT